MKYVYYILIFSLIISSDFLDKSVINYPIPKKNIAKANNRNLLKRLVRGAYRKQKRALYKALSKQEKQIIFGIIYQKSDLLKYKEVESEINLVLNRLIKQF